MVKIPIKNERKLERNGNESLNKHTNFRGLNYELVSFHFQRHTTRPPGAFIVSCLKIFRISAGEIFVKEEENLFPAPVPGSLTPMSNTKELF